MSSEPAVTAAELRFRQDAIERLKRRDPETGVMLLEGLVRFFDDGVFWARKNDGLHGDRCLAGGLSQVRQICGLPSCEPGFYYLGQAISPNGGAGTPTAIQEWNAQCGQFSQLRAVIAKARDLALVDRQRLQEVEASMPPPRRRHWWIKPE